ncbi:helix-turn-helix domain-containing protein [Sutcliffiella deserti]|uniref:helix-turn-helix domain-containing protein n=1 Tax=Sutcliffiella deserti TaxID=2875501 RepID=UPI001CBCDB71|nr:helix-turn-helix transcriptional regulator [Sutcliffiella deserti]
MRLGNIIKYYREKKGFSRERLSQNCFTTSQLTSFELNETEPSTHQLEVIAEKLELNKSLFSQTSCPILEEKLFSCYKSTISHNQKEAWKKLTLFNEEHQIGLTTTYVNTFLLYLIIKLNYFLLIQDKKVIDSLYEEISGLPKSLNSQIEYVRKRTLGIYYYRKNNNLKSTQLLKEALTMVVSHPVCKEDCAGLYYQIALTSHKTSEIYDSIHYAEKALKIYEELVSCRRAAECHIILGLNYQKIYQYQLAEANYKSAKIIGGNLQDIYLQSMALHNLGFNQSCLGNSEDAIFYFLESLKMKKQEDRCLYTYYTLAKEYYKLDLFEFARGWADEGLVLAKRSKIEDYIIHFTVFIYLLENNPKLETYISNYVLPYFTSAGNKGKVAQYAETLADYHSKKENYQNASTYYQMSLQVQKGIAGAVY